MSKNIEQRRKEVLDYLLNFGPFGIPPGTKKEFAEKYNVSTRQIEREEITTNYRDNLLVQGLKRIS